VCRNPTDEECESLHILIFDLTKPRGSCKEARMSWPSSMDYLCFLVQESHPSLKNTGYLTWHSLPWINKIHRSERSLRDE